jgi:hypothetical protein
MHWCASVGTEYRLVRLRRIQEGSRTATVIAVICLVSPCLHVVMPYTLTVLESPSVLVSSLRAQLFFEPELSSKLPVVLSRLNLAPLFSTRMDAF